MLIQFGIAFAAGVLAFLSPCVAPILPGVAAAITGSRGVAQLRWSLIPRVVAFAFGAAVVFVGSVTAVLALGLRLNLQEPPWSYVVGGILVAVGVVGLTGMKLSWLKIPELSGGWGWMRAFVLGVCCAAVWYPCIGPSLVAIFGLASRTETVWSAILLAIGYFLGLCVPIILLGVVLVTVPATRRAVVRFGRYVSVVLSVLVIVMGVAVASGLWAWVSLEITRVFPTTLL